jgi:transcriptional regulator with XRE-family HTH domain
MSFGDAVRARRQELHIGLVDFAERLGITAAYWSRVERNLEKPPKDLLIEKAAAILGVRLDDLFVEAHRLPPDMQRDLSQVVTLYRRMRAVRR